jgi:hypothetical protein
MLGRDLAVKRAFCSVSKQKTAALSTRRMSARAKKAYIQLSDRDVCQVPCVDGSGLASHSKLFGGPQGAVHAKPGATRK